MSRLALIAALAGIPVAAVAQDGPDLRFTAGLGAGVQPEYFGSDEYAVGPTGSFRFGYARLGGFEFGSLEDGEARGLSFTGAFRFLPERSASDFPELAGLDDIDASVELGVGVAYTTASWEAFGNLRYGVVGHESLVGTLGSNVIVRPSDRLTLRAGPRIEIGSADFNQTYFGVTAAEAGASAFDAYSPDAGLYLASVEVEAEYDLSPVWSVAGSVEYGRLLGEAEDSPIVQAGDDTRLTASVVLRRTFTIDW